MIPDRLNWMDAYIGFKNHFIKAGEVMNFYYNKKLSSIEDNLIVDLENGKDSEMDFLKILEQIAISSCIKEGLDFVVESEKSEKLWQLSFLKQIANSSEDIDTKLMLIENLWARFGYPSEWENFIYYMPNEKLINKSKESVYQNFLRFLEGK